MSRVYGRMTKDREGSIGSLKTNLGSSTDFAQQDKQTFYINNATSKV